MAIVVGQTTWQFPFNPNAPEQFLIGSCTLGSTAPCGGSLICKNGGVAWIVAPNTSEVSRTWALRNDAVTTATACTSTDTWFIPTVSQLQNPGYSCRTFWDSFSSTRYWSSTEGNATNACYVLFNIGNANYGNKAYTRCVRAFRCVTY
jgi:hypothetical protein